MAIDTPNPAYPGDLRIEYTDDIVDFIQQTQVNRYPIMARVDRQPVYTPEFLIRHFPYSRPRKYQSTAGLSGTGTYSVLTIPDQSPTFGIQTGDSSCLMAGDVLEVSSTGERLEVISTPNRDPAAQPLIPTGQSVPNAGTILVKRGAESTTATGVPDPSGGATTPLVLIGNSRTGGEIWPSGLRSRPITVMQQCQNYEFPVNVTGTAQSTRYNTTDDLFTNTKDQQFKNMMDDLEMSSVYGIGEMVGTGPSNANVPGGLGLYGQAVNGNGFTIGNRPKQRGIRYQCFGQVTATNGSNYLPSNFEADVMAPFFDLKKEPNIMLCSRTFFSGLVTWGLPAVRIDVGETRYGIQVKAYQSNLAPDLEIVPCPTLRPGDAIIGRSDLMTWRTKRPEFWQDWGIRGDRKEGEWIAEGAIQLTDPEAWTFLTGVSQFGKP